MRSLKVLLLAVVLPGLLSLAFFSSLRSERHEHVVRVEAPRVEALRLHAVQVEAERVRTAGVFSRARCDYGREQVTSLEGAGLSLLRVEAGSGSLRVEGRRGTGDVVVRARMCASTESLLEGLAAHLERAGDVAELDTDHPRSYGSGSHYARIDLEIELPLGLAADLEDSSGEMYVAGTGDTRISDGSGEIEVRGVNGSLTIRDGSGEIALRDVGGDVEIVDGSGGMSLLDVAGRVTLTDGSGDIEILDVAGDVHVRADGSGSIGVEEVSGDFRVDADGSGSISHSRVDGRVSVPRSRR